MILEIQKTPVERVFSALRAQVLVTTCSNSTIELLPNNLETTRSMFAFSVFMRATHIMNVAEH